MSVIVIPSARSNTTRARLASPARMFVARCHARSVWRSADVRRIMNEVLRPRAIRCPCVRRVETVPKSAILTTLLGETCVDGTNIGHPCAYHRGPSCSPAGVAPPMGDCHRPIVTRDPCKFPGAYEGRDSSDTQLKWVTG